MAITLLIPTHACVTHEREPLVIRIHFDSPFPRGNAEKIIFSWANVTNKCLSSSISERTMVGSIAEQGRQIVDLMLNGRDMGTAELGYSYSPTRNRTFCIRFG